MTSDLQTGKWAVISERGCEATQLTHEEARWLVRKLEGEGRHGLCIVTTEAAHRTRPIAGASESRASAQGPR